MRISIPETGFLQCDKDGCDYREDGIINAELETHINKPCPKCGENLLTLEDYNNAQFALKGAEFINSLTDEEMEELGKIAEENGTAAEIRKMIPEHKEGDAFIMKVGTHKKVTIDSIEVQSK